jgi:serine/threonine-protein kinase
MLLSLDAQRRLRPVMQTSFLERNGQISPDGRWLAYESNESGRTEVYVRPFPDVSGGRWQVSTDGGERPLWARDGGELFYVPPTGGLMRMPVNGRTTWAANSPTKLLEGPYLWRLPAVGGPLYDVSPDGTRFLLLKAAEASEQATGAANLVIVQNWFEELKRLVPVN